MIKKLYSTETSDDTEDSKKKDGNESLMSDMEGLDKSEDMMKALSKRSIFSYKYMRDACLRRMNSFYCCCCKPRL